MQVLMLAYCASATVESALSQQLGHLLPPGTQPLSIRVWILISVGSDSTGSPCVTIPLWSLDCFPVVMASKEIRQDYIWQ